MPGYQLCGRGGTEPARRFLRGTPRTGHLSSPHNPHPNSKPFRDFFVGYVGPMLMVGGLH